MILALTLTAALAAASPYRPLPADAPQPVVKLKRPGVKTAGNSVTSGKDGRSGLPYAFGHSFASLDEYLVHLKRYASPIDLPWWREIGPDRFEHVRRMTGVKNEVASRAELMRRFGFTR